MRGAVSLPMLKRLGIDIDSYFPYEGDISAEVKKVYEESVGKFPLLETYWKSPLTKADEKRRRYRGMDQAEQIFENLGVRFSMGLTAYINLMNEEERIEVLGTLNRMGFNRMRDPEAARLALKELGGYAKRNRELFSKNWRFYVNLENVGGYINHIDEVKIAADVQDWVNSPDIPDEFLGLFRNGVKEFLGYASQMNPTDYIGRRAFARKRGLWQGSGAVPMPVHKIGKVRLRKTKNLAAMTYSNERLEEMIMNRYPQDNKVILKREPGKIRPVINTDLPMYLKMSYVSYFLDRMLSGHPHTTLYMTGPQREELIRKRMYYVKNEGWCMPVDQSRFDHHVGCKMLAIVCDEIKKLFHGFSEIEHCVEDIAHDICNGTVDYNGIKYSLKGGVMSGWRWTAMVDTIVNYAELYTACWSACGKGPSTFLDLYVAQGDDLDLIARDPVDLIKISEGMKTMGLEVNPKKFWLAQGMDEFLRKLCDGEEEYGYPARLMPSLLWRNPASDPGALNQGRLSEITNNWVKAIARGLNPQKVGEAMLDDVKGAFNTTELGAEAMITAPVVGGGAGIGASQVKVEYEREEAKDVPKSWLSNLWGKDTFLRLVDGPWRTRRLVKIEVIPYKYEEVSIGNIGVAMDSVPNIAQLDEELDPVYGRILISRRLEERNWSGVKELLNQRCQGLFDILKNRFQRWLFVEWLTHGVEFSKTPSIYVPEVMLADKAYDQAAWYKLLKKHRASRRYFENLSYSRQVTRVKPEVRAYQ
jgi:hypothetical protein